MPYSEIELIEILRRGLVQKLSEDKKLFGKDSYVQIQIKDDKFMLYLTSNSEDIIIERVKTFSIPSVDKLN